MEELNTFEKTLPDKLDFLIKLKQFVSLEKNSLKELAEAAKTSLQPVFDDLKEYERVANNKPKSNIKIDGIA